MALSAGDSSRSTDGSFATEDEGVVDGGGGDVFMVGSMGCSTRPPLGASSLAEHEVVTASTSDAVRQMSLLFPVICLDDVFMAIDIPGSCGQDLQEGRSCYLLVPPHWLRLSDCSRAGRMAP